MTPFVRHPSHAGPERVGGKGHQLLALMDLGFTVPEFLVIPTDAGELSAERWQELQGIVQAWQAPWLAVRSSVTGEDGLDASFAGLFESFLYVPLHQLREKVLAAQRALVSERVQAYCREKNIRQELKMAVIVQKMLDPRVSGVAFSRSPVAPTADVVIDAAFGVGEGVVAGLVDTDHWRYSRLLELVEERLAEKKSAMGSHHDGGTCGVEVPIAQWSAPCLTPHERERLVRATLTLEKKRGHPVDVEWAMVGDELYFLQVRPITQAFPPLKSYTDTNLTESYPGVVSPFTASFVKLGYRNVFAESAVLLGAKGARLAELMGHYQSLVAEVGHHLYYDLEHYYAVLSALPGGEKNIENWHRMIGGKKEGMEVAIKIAPLGRGETLSAAWRLLKLACTQERVMSRFSESLQAHKKILRDRLAESDTPQKTFQLIHQTLSLPMGFGLTALNDVLLMLGVKGLSSLLASQGLTEEVLAPLLKTGEEVESLKPLKALSQLVAGMPADFWEPWQRLCETAPDWGDAYQPLWAELSQLGFKDESARLATFLASYGDRSFEELKLESPTLRQSPGDLLRLMLFLRHKPQSASRSQGEAAVPVVFTGWRKLAWRWCWGLTKRSIFWREHTRLLRGQFFNIVREMLMKGAEQLRREYPAFQNFERLDFFTPTLADYQRFANHELSETELAQLMVERGDWKSAQGPFAEFLVSAIGETPLKPLSGAPVGGELTGQRAAPGVVSGEPLVLEHPAEALERRDLSGCILVTRHTDPAWVYIMSQCRGLISEKGSLLSHTAIIGRELGIPTLVGVRGAVNLLRGVSRITLDAEQGKVEIHGS